MISRTLRPLTLGAASLAVAASLHAQSERKTLTGQQVAIYNLVGRVQVETGTGSDVTVEVTRRGRDASRLRLESGELRGRNTLRIIYPDDDIVYSDRSSDDRRGNNSSRWDWSFGWGKDNRTELRVRDDGTWGNDDGRSYRGEGRRVRVYSSGRGTEAWADLVIRVPAGKTLSVYTGVGETDARNTAGDFLLENQSGHMTVTGHKGNLRLDTGSGGIEARDVSGDDVRIDTGSGGVRFTGITGKHCKMETGSGGVIGDKVSCDELDVDSGSGSIRVDDAKSERVKLDSGSGGLSLSLLTSPKSLVAESGSGGVTVSLPSTLNAEVDIETGSGSIDTDWPIKTTRYERHHLRGTIGDGSGRIRIETGSGSVRLRKN